MTRQQIRIYSTCFARNARNWPSSKMFPPTWFFPTDHSRSSANPCPQHRSSCSVSTDSARSRFSVLAHKFWRSWNSSPPHQKPKLSGRITRPAVASNGAWRSPLHFRSPERVCCILPGEDETWESSHRMSYRARHNVQTNQIEQTNVRKSEVHRVKAARTLLLARDWGRPQAMTQRTHQHHTVPSPASGWHRGRQRTPIQSQT